MRVVISDLIVQQTQPDSRYQREAGQGDPDPQTAQPPGEPQEGQQLNPRAQGKCCLQKHKDSKDRVLSCSTDQLTGRNNVGSAGRMAAEGQFPDALGWDK